MKKVFTACLSGLRVNTVEVEIDSASGLPGFQIVGLPDKAVNESKERVRAAIKHSHLIFPQKKLTINLSPASLKKVGSGFDLAVAVAILVASEQIETPSDLFYFGELALSGELKPVRGIVPIVGALTKLNPQAKFIIPRTQLDEAALVKGAALYPVRSLSDLAAFFRGEKEILAHTGAGIDGTTTLPAVDFSIVSGNAHAKRALEVAAAGGHHVLMSGPPGSGKTLLAKAFVGILPPPSREELVEINSIYSACGLLNEARPYLNERPFRSPHHTASSSAIVGGGAEIRPGEITLAHRGVLFLDELPEFQRPVLEALREPLEDRRITIARASGSELYPASFQLIASQNPCPCGNYGSEKNACMCQPARLFAYQTKLSGAILDRIDLRVTVPAYRGDISDGPAEESSRAVRLRVEKARQFAGVRGQKTLNAELSLTELKRFCTLEPAGVKLLEAARDKFGLSLRSVHKIIRTARTIADLAQSEDILSSHLGEALLYRLRDTANEPAAAF